MKHFIQLFFVICILIIIFLPLLFTSNKKVSEKENRALAKFPSLMMENHFNKNLFVELDNYFQDHFGFRNLYILINAKNPVKVKSSSSIEKAIEGKDDWYFYTDPSDGNNLLDFYKRNLFTSMEIEQFSDKIGKIVKWCKDNNIKCLFIISPNKHSVYEEYYPYNRPDGITRADQIIQVFDNLNVSYVFPRDFLISNKTNYNYPLYYECGTHWNSLGAYLVSQQIKNEIELLFVPTVFPEITWKIKGTKNTLDENLLPMIGRNPADAKKNTMVIMEVENGNISDYYDYIEYDDRNVIHTKGKDNSLPRALIFRDSFFRALEPFISPLFYEAEYHRKNFRTSDKDYILKYKPDIIIFEIVERNIKDLIE